MADEKDINQNIDLEEDFEDEEEIITLFNEETQKEEEFRIIEVIDHDEKEYVLLNPVEPDEEIGEDEVIICEIGEDENGEGYILPVDSEETLQAIYDKYVAMYEEEEGCCCDDECDCDDECECDDKCECEKGCDCKK